MSSRSYRVRTKVVALLVSLFALWAFAAYVTVREGLNLLWIATLDQNVGRPSDSLVAALQQERRLSLIYLGSRDATDRKALEAQRTRTDETKAAFQQLASSGKTRLAANGTVEQLIGEALGRLDELGAARESIDAQHVSRTAASDRFTEIIDTQFRLYEPAAALDDQEIAKDGRTLIALTRARELLSREDALLAGVLAEGTFTASEHQMFIQLVGAQRFVYEEAARELPPADHARYEQMVNGDAFRHLRDLEGRVVEWNSTKKTLPVGAGEWKAATDEVFAQVRDLVRVAANDAVDRTKPAAALVLVRLALAGGLGLIAVIASIVVYITTARALVRQLGRLRNAANELASYRLPRVVERLQHGEKVDVDHEAPPLDFGRDEIGQVGQAFNTVQSTAIRVAVEQAELRRSVRDVFLSLARRSQALLHRQLGLLDAMERRATDSEELAELFRIDHLATRMRRNAENLIVLSGATAGRAWRKPVPMIDVLRGALAEVEDYTRVTVVPVSSALLAGRAVGDVIHLLAELIENAVSFSPPQTIVRLGGSVVGNGFAIEIEDRGLGMSDEDREAANAQLADPPEFRLSSTARLGLYVVGKLAERHGIRVRLTPSPYGGTTAIVLIPSTLMAEESTTDLEAIEAVAGDDGARRASLAIAGRHRGDASAGTPGPPATATTPDVATPDAAAPAFASPRGSDDDTLRLVSREDPSPAPSGPGPRRSDPPILTPAGLPWRKRDPARGGDQPARPAIPTRAPHPPPATAPSVPATAPPTAAQIGRAGRGPEEIRNIMSSYRSGTLRGRTEAAHLAAETNHHAPDRTPPAQEPSGTDEGA